MFHAFHITISEWISPVLISNSYFYSALFNTSWVTPTVCVILHSTESNTHKLRNFSQYLHMVNGLNPGASVTDDCYLFGIIVRAKEVFRKTVVLVTDVWSTWVVVWSWLPFRQSKHQSATTVFFKTSFTRTVMPNKQVQKERKEPNKVQTKSASTCRSGGEEE